MDYTRLDGKDSIVVTHDEIEALPLHNTSEELSQGIITKFSWRDAWKEAGWVFLLSRLALLALTFLGPSVFAWGVNHGKSWQAPLICVSHMTQCINYWNTWDVGVFADIARAGYYKSDHSLAPFFPLWPLLIHIADGYFHPTSLSLFYTSLILTNIFFLCGLVLLYQIICDYFSPTIAKDTLLLLALNPYGLFFFVGYSEALFLLLCVGMFFFLQRGRTLDWWLAGLCGCLAALTRATGVALAIPFFVLLVQHFWSYRTQLFAHWRELLNKTLPLTLIPLGLILYMLYLAITTGNPLEFGVIEAVRWGRHLDFPWTGIINNAYSLLPLNTHFESNLMDMLFTLLPIIALCISWKSLPWHYRFFTLAMLLLSLCSPIDGNIYPLSSMPRFMMVIFPLFIIFALWGRKYPRLRSVLIGASLVLFTFHALLFLTNGWVA